MPRPIWTGHISFGLVNIPIQLYTAESRSSGVSFHLIDRRNNSRVRNRRVNEATGEEVPYEEIVKGYELEDGSYVTFTEEDFDKLEIEANQNIEIEEFVELGDVDCAYFDKPYFLLPGRKGDKGYVLLREALKESGRVGIAKVVIRTRQYLSALVPEGDGLMLFLMRYADELRKPDQEKLPSGSLEDFKVSKKELEIAGQLIDSMSADWEPEKYQDDYQEALLEVIDQKAKTGKVTLAGPDEEAEEEEGDVIDIMELLKKSMAKEKKGSKKKA